MLHMELRIGRFVAIREGVVDTVVVDDAILEDLDEGGAFEPCAASSTLPSPSLSMSIARAMNFAPAPIAKLPGRIGEYIFF